MKVKFLLFIFALSGFLSQAQDYNLLTQQEVLTQVQQKNAKIKIAGYNTRLAQADYQQSAAVFLPELGISHQATTTTNPLMAFGSKLNQEILTPIDFDPTRLNNPEAIENFQTKASIQMPLLHLDGIYERKAAKKAWQAAQYQEQHTQTFMVYQAKLAYMQLQLAHKNYAVLQKILVAAQAHLKMAQDNRAAGYLQDADVLLVQMRVSDIQNKLNYAKSAIQNASDQLNLMMGNNLATAYQPADSLQLQMVPLSTNYNLQQRNDIMAKKQATEAQKNLLRAARMQFLPQLAAFGSYEWHDDALFGTQAEGYWIGAQISWTLFEGGQRFAKNKRAKNEWEKAVLETKDYEQESLAELEQAKRQLQDAEREVARAELAVEQAKEALRIRANRFKAGLEKTTELLQAEAVYAQKRLQYYQSIYGYNQALYYVNFLTN